MPVTNRPSVNPCEDTRKPAPCDYASPLAFSGFAVRTASVTTWPIASDILMIPSPTAFAIDAARLCAAMPALAVMTRCHRAASNLL